MQITFRPFELRLANRWTIARSLEKEQREADIFRVVFVELREADGTVGLGESAPSSRYGESITTVQDWLSRVDASRISFDDVAGSMAYLQNLGAGDPAAWCAMNVALLDGASRRAGRRVHDHLGLPFEEGRHVTSFSIGIDSPDVIRRKVLEADPYPILKLKVGAPRDRENLAALREVAPGKRVRVDGNEAWKTKEQALRQIEWLASDPHIEFVEQPMPASTPAEDLAWLKSRSPLPLMADESYATAANAARCAEGFHSVNVKLVKTGGISGAYDALQAARRAGLKTMLGCMIESSLLITAAAHLAALTDYLDIDGNLLITNDPYQGVTAVGGVISFRSAPEPTGLGVRGRA